MSISLIDCAFLLPPKNGTLKPLFRLQPEKMKINQILGLSSTFSIERAHKHNCSSVQICKSLSTAWHSKPLCGHETAAPKRAPQYFRLFAGLVSTPASTARFSFLISINAGGRLIEALVFICNQSLSGRKKTRWPVQYSVCLSQEGCG